VDAGTRYARSGDAHIAYQVLGEGGPDLLYLSSGTISIDSIDEEPGFARFHRGLASFSRLIRMDLRGIGLSDPIDPRSRRRSSSGSATRWPSSTRWARSAPHSAAPTREPSLRC
jgi:pimeloyl-ACP methyl ester carboxylesterase